MKLKIPLLAACLAALTLPGANAQVVLLEWDFFGDNSSNRPTMNSTFNATGIDSSVLSRGAGAAASAAANSFRTTGFQNNGISLTNTDYFQWGFTVDTGRSL